MKLCAPPPLLAATPLLASAVREKERQKYYIYCNTLIKLLLFLGGRVRLALVGRRNLRLPLWFWSYGVAAWLLPWRPRPRPLLRAFAGISLSVVNANHDCNWGVCLALCHGLIANHDCNWGVCLALCHGPIANHDCTWGVPSPVSWAHCKP